MQPPHVPDDLRDPDHGHVADVGQEIGAFGEKVIAPRSKDLEPGPMGPQVTNELARVQITGGLAAGDEQARHGSGQGTQYKAERETPCASSPRRGFCPRGRARCLRDGTPNRCLLVANC
jgi:hypothetical protein